MPLSEKDVRENQLKLLRVEIQTIGIFLKIFLAFIKKFPFWLPSARSFDLFDQWNRTYRDLSAQYRALNQSDKNDTWHSEVLNQHQQARVVCSHVEKELQDIFTCCKTVAEGTTDIQQAIEATSEAYFALMGQAHLLYRQSEERLLSTQDVQSFIDCKEALDKNFFLCVHIILQFKSQVSLWSSELLVANNRFRESLQEDFNEACRLQGKIAHMEDHLKRFDLIGSGWVLPDVSPVLPKDLGWIKRKTCQLGSFFGYTYPFPPFDDFAFLFEYDPLEVVNSLERKKAFLKCHFERTCEKITRLKGRFGLYLPEMVRLARIMDLYLDWEEVLNHFEALKDRKTAKDVLGFLNHQKKAAFKKSSKQQTVGQIIRWLYRFVEKELCVDQEREVVYQALQDEKEVDRIRVEEKEKRLTEAITWRQWIWTSLVSMVQSDPHFTLGAVTFQSVENGFVGEMFWRLPRQVCEVSKNTTGFGFMVVSLGIARYFNALLYKFSLMLNREILSQLPLFKIGRRLGSDELTLTENDSTVQMLMGLTVHVGMGACMGYAVIPMGLGYVVATRCNAGLSHLLRRGLLTNGVNTENVQRIETMTGFVTYPGFYAIGRNVGLFFSPYRVIVNEMPCSEAIRVLKLPKEILELPRDEARGEIGKFFRELIRNHHPDKGGDPKKVAELNAAYHRIKRCI